MEFNVYDDANSSRNRLMEMASGYIIARSIHVAAILGVADCFVDGPISCDAVAHKLGLDAGALYRLLRLLASYGIFAEQGDLRIFSLTPLAEPLLSSHPKSLRSWLMFHGGDEMRWRSYGAMDRCIRTGKDAFSDIFGDKFFDCIARDDVKARSFDEGMRNIADEEDRLLSEAYDYSSFAHIIDIGAGIGGLMVNIVQRVPSVIVTLYDMPHVMPSAEAYLVQHGVRNRFKLVSGSFFDSVPGGADLYIMKRVLHDWSDEDCVTILRNVKRVMDAGSRLWIFEAVVAEGNTRDFVKDVDIEMMVLFRGKERTLQDWTRLIEQAGLVLVKTDRVDGLMVSLLEVVLPAAEKAL